MHMSQTLFAPSSLLPNESKACGERGVLTITAITINKAVCGVLVHLFVLGLFRAVVATTEAHPRAPPLPTRCSNCAL